mmetsp:Transcript_21054/g.46176  ORF Transcript_21054/g.46176 Transcript_21054/m.46176 type:complete len:298 (+) Transcript_21054:1287-2180(+)
MVGLGGAGRGRGGAPPLRRGIRGGVDDRQDGHEEAGGGDGGDEVRGAPPQGGAVRAGGGQHGEHRLREVVPHLPRPRPHLAQLAERLVHVLVPPRGPAALHRPIDLEPLQVEARAAGRGRQVAQDPGEVHVQRGARGALRPRGPRGRAAVGGDDLALHLPGKYHDAVVLPLGARPAEGQQSVLQREPPVVLRDGQNLRGLDCAFGVRGCRGALFGVCDFRYSLVCGLHLYLLITNMGAGLYGGETQCHSVSFLDPFMHSIQACTIDPHNLKAVELGGETDVGEELGEPKLVAIRVLY